MNEIFRAIEKVAIDYTVDEETKSYVLQKGELFMVGPDDLLVDGSLVIEGRASTVKTLASKGKWFSKVRDDDGS